MGKAISVVGMHGGEVFGAQARRALATADVLVGSDRHLDCVVNDTAERWQFHGALKPLLDQVLAAAAERSVCLLASGDPGFFGIVRALGQMVEPERLQIFPAPSSVALAAARVGISWDDVAVVSAHGRPLGDAVAEVQRVTNAAVLTAPATPPEALGQALLAIGRSYTVDVCSRLGTDEEAIVHTDLAGLAAGRFDGLSVVFLRSAEPSRAPTLRWGRPTDVFDHRAGMITKPEVRTIVLARLDLPADGVLWDIGAGSGSVAIEAAALSPRLKVFAIEQNTEDAARVRANADVLGVSCEVVCGTAPGALVDLPDPDRVFVGGGGLDALDAALGRLRPGGVVVATYAALDRAAAAHVKLGHLTQVSISQAVPLSGAGGLRLVADNPVFVAWGSRS